MDAVHATTEELSDHVFAGGIPHAVFDQYRRTLPCFRAPLRATDAGWHLFRYEDVSRALKDWQTYSSHSGGTTLQDQSPIQVLHNTSLLHTDPPAHTRLRSSFHRSMAPAALEPYAEAFDVIAREVVGDALAFGVADVPSLIGSRMASYSLCSFLGVPGRLRDHFLRLSALMLADSVPVPQPGGQMQALTGVCDPNLLSGSPAAAMVDLLMTYCYESSRSDAFGQDFPDGAGSAAVEDVLVILATAGTGMTMNAIATMVWQLATNWDELVDASGALRVDELGVVEESLRFATPLMHTRRTATADAEVAGQRIAAGEKVVLWLASANFDADVFESPMLFDPQRSPNPHLSFARNSPHHCLGAAFARAEMRSILRSIVSSCRRLEVVEGPVYLASDFVNEMTSLKVAFTGRTA